MTITKKVLLPVLLASATTTSVFAATNSEGNGKVNFHGYVIDAPCSIAPESLDQTVELGQVSNKVLKMADNSNLGQSTPQNFVIQLVDCDIDTENAAQNVTITFTGANPVNTANSLPADTVLATTGQASGIGIQMTDQDSTNIVQFNKETTVNHYLQNGSNTLMFSAYVTGLGTDEINPGEFFGVTDFTLSYK